MTKLTMAISVVCVGLTSSPATWAQDTADLDALLGESVSSTASKSAQASTAVPGLAVNVTSEDLRRYGIKTLAEAYNFLALGIISQDPLGDAEVGSRGVLFTNDAGKHVLLLIDGHVTNDQRTGASYHTQAAGIPLELIDHIEIILGPGSVLYGANATLGVVNVVTKRARDLGAFSLIAEATASPRENQAHRPVLQVNGQGLADIGRTYRLGAGVGKTLQLGGQATEITGQVEYYAMTGPRLGWSPITTGNFSYGPYAPVGVWGGDTHRSWYQYMPDGYLRVQRGDLQLTLHGLASRTSTPYSRIQDFNRDFDDPQSYTDRGYGAVDISWNRVVSERTSLSARLYGDASQEYSQLRTSSFISCPGSEPNGCTHTSDGRARWAGAELQTTIKWLSDLSMATMLGLEGRLRHVGFASGLRDRATGVPVAGFEKFGQYESDQATGAIYAQQVYNPFPSLTLNAGARLDLDQQFGQRLSPRGAVAMEVWHGGTAKMIYSEAFRAPTMEELHLTNEFLVLAAPNLVPEIVRSAEALIQQRIGTQRMVAGVFGSWWNNVVYRQHLPATELQAQVRAGVLDSSTVNAYQFRNVARVYNLGVNASYEGNIPARGLSYGANITAAYSRVDTAGMAQQMTVTPFIYGNARVSYDSGGRLPVVGLATQISGKRLADNAYDADVTTRLVAPPMVDVRLTFSGHVPRAAFLQYRLSADFAFAPTSPYAANLGSSDHNQTELVPVNRTTVLFGLQYQY